MMQILRLQVPCLSRGSRGSLLISQHSPLHLELQLQRLSPSAASTPWSPAVGLGHQRAAALTRAWQRTSLPLLSSCKHSIFSRGFWNSQRNAMLRKLSICTGWKSAKRSSHSPHRRRLQIRSNGTIALKAVGSVTGKDGVNWVEEPDTQASLEDEGREGKSISVEAPSEKQWDDVIPVEDAKFLASIMTRYNFIRVLEVAKTSDHPMAGSRVLLLDKFGNVHSLYHEYRLLTDSYYDVFPSLPSIIPDGPIGIFGLAAGTAARLIHHFWPELDIYGWELDPAVVYVARKYFNLEELEWSETLDSEEQEQVACAPVTEEGFMGPVRYRKWKGDNYSVFMENAASMRRPKGRLRVLVGDALSPEASVDGGFAGIIVDLFAGGAVISALQEPGVWREMKKKLRPGGRIMVNCGGSCVDAGVGKKDGRITMEETVAAIAQEFPNQLSILPLRCRGDNYIALTGPLPDLQAWCETLPECLRMGCEDWVSFSDRQKFR